jgi:hypothetical protein
LDGREAMRQGGDSGPVLVPGKSGASLLIQAIRHEGGLAMPSESPQLPAQVIADFQKWVDMGAPDPRRGGAAGEAQPGLDEARRHWAFQPVQKPDPPPVRDTDWLASGVDAFVLAGLEMRSWRPAPPASRAEWLRRVCFDLTGLPPEPEEVRAFIDDRAADAEQRVVDRLLASPQYGERWAQHWLDVIRYAETEGYEYDRHIPGAWRFRDYVIASLNSDKPFDQFVTEQVAGDEIGGDDPDCLVASIFHRLGPVRRNAGNAEIALSRNEVLTERTDILGAAFLGLTVGCARCHNHKLEPISQRDYYSLQSYLAATDEHNIVLVPAEQQQVWESQTRRINAQIQSLKKRARGVEADEKARLQREVDALEAQLPPPLPTIPATRNRFEARTPIHILRRGVWESKGEPVAPRPLSVLVPDELAPLPSDVPDPRTRLARWLASPDHPLTPRVIVNRLWQHHFGIGLVKTANDFGVRGDRPSHPELLDWLAATLIEHGWRLKPMHRLIVLSSAYRQSHRSPLAPAYEQDDPDNRLLWRFNRRRLSAEELRDAMLQVSGRLNHRAGGPSVMVPVDPELVGLLYAPAQWQVATSVAEHDRRSIYLIAKRNLRLPFVEAFDAPALLTSCARREGSTHAPQALEMLNGWLSNDLARSLACRLQDEAEGDAAAMVERAYWLAAGRAPTPTERELSLAFLREQPLEEFALAMFNLNGFFYVP